MRRVSSGRDRPPSGAGAASSRASQRVFVAVNYKRPTGHLGAFFTHVADLLTDSGNWRRKDKAIGSYDLILGESIGRGIPFKDLSKKAAAAAAYASADGVRGIGGSSGSGGGRHSGSGIGSREDGGGGGEGWDIGGADGPLTNFTRYFKSLTWKVDLVECLRDHARRMGIDLWKVVPESYLFYAGDLAACERREFLDAFARHAESGDRNVWILKPSGGGKGGRIVVMDNLRDIGDHLAQELRTTDSDWVVSKYLERPMLLRGNRKFDMRCWVVVTHDYKILLYRQGVLRTGSVAYNLDRLDDVFVHLSNHCIQVKHPGYGKYEPTNEMWYHEFSEYIRTAFPDSGVDFVRDIIPQIRALIVMSLEAARPFLFQPPGSGYASFHMFGYDFMIDADFKVWLIEINSSPAAAEYIKPRLTADLIKVAIDPIFPPPSPAAAPARKSGSRASATSGSVGSRASRRSGGSDAGAGPLDESGSASGAAAAGDEAAVDDVDRGYGDPAEAHLPYTQQWGFERLDTMAMDWRPFMLAGRHAGAAKRSAGKAGAAAAAKAPAR